MSKAVIKSVTAFALRYAPHGTRVNAVSAGAILTAMWHEVDLMCGAKLGLAPGQLTTKMGKEIPLGRPGTPNEVAHLIAFLLSDEATYIAGQIITIDGGFRLRSV